MSETDVLFAANEAAAQWFEEMLQHPRGLSALEYARSRGFSPETMARFRFGCAPDAWDNLFNVLTQRKKFSPADCVAAGLLVENGNGGHYDRFRHRLTFPICDTYGRVVAFAGRALEGGSNVPKDGAAPAKYLNSPEGELFHKGRVLFAWHLAQPEMERSGVAIVTEGPMDAIALHEAGFTNAVAVQGTALTEHHAQELSRYRVLLCFDGDKAGERAVLRTAGFLLPLGADFRVVRLPEGQDPDSLIRKAGAGSMSDYLERAIPLPRFLTEQAIRRCGALGLARALQEVAPLLALLPDETGRVELINYLIEKFLFTLSPCPSGAARHAMFQAVHKDLWRHVQI